MTERRSSKRIPVNIDAGIFQGNMFYIGKVRNLSGSGMLLETHTDISSEKLISVLLSTKNDLPRLAAKVKRHENKKGTVLEIGVELIEPPKKYRDFVEDLSYYQYL